MTDSISIIIAVIALILSFITFLLTRRDTWTGMRSATYSSIMNRLFVLNQLELEKPYLFEKLYDEFDEDVVEKGGRGLSHYVFMVLNLYGEIYTQHEQYHLFDDHDWQAWQRRIENDFRHRPFLRGFWRWEKANYGDEYSVDLVDFLDSALEKAEKHLSQEESFRRNNMAQENDHQPEARNVYHEYSGAYEQAIQRVHHEDTMINNRLGWLLNSQTIFFAVYALLFQQNFSALP